MLLGFFKKLVIADQLAALVAYGFDHPGLNGAGLIGLYLFPLQLYADFSGLADIAIGTALLFGIRSPENFDAPFRASNISEFWRRWHMTLTNWLKDYVFMPLRMSTRDWGNTGLALSIGVNMMLIALWHGMSLLFIVFGVFQALLMIAEALSTKKRKLFYARHPGMNTVMSFLGPVLTYQLMAVSLVLVRSRSFAQALAVFGSFANLTALPAAIRSATAPPYHYVWVAFPAYVLAELGDYLRRRPPVMIEWARPLRWSAYAALGVLAAFVTVRFLAGQMDTNPFVYANF
jgi:D-alanyl-lipoteichoic acid acyltransferase DltB (MBOAT superfamily)